MANEVFSATRKTTMVMVLEMETGIRTLMMREIQEEPLEVVFRLDYRTLLTIAMVLVMLAV